MTNLHLFIIFVFIFQLVRLASPPGETGMLVVDSVVSELFSHYLISFFFFLQLILTAMPAVISIVSYVGIIRIQPHPDCLIQVPGGPAHKHLEPGDVLIRLNGEVVFSYS